jgi:hypothetical protein
MGVRQHHAKRPAWTKEIPRGARAGAKSGQPKKKERKVLQTKRYKLTKQRWRCRGDGGGRMNLVGVGFPRKPVHKHFHVQQCIGLGRARFLLPSCHRQTNLIHSGMGQEQWKTRRPEQKECRRRIGMKERRSSKSGNSSIAGNEMLA